jgi:uncharacterized protein
MPSAPLSKPLSDAEISSLQEWLLALPEEREALDVMMLDGYLTGVLLQPELVLPSAWLPLVFDAQGRELDFPGDHADAERVVGLIMRRYNEIAAYIMAREPFDPIVFELEGEDGKPLEGKAAIPALSFWAAGFLNALHSFPGLLDHYGDDADVAVPLSGILRHLPEDPDGSPEVAAAMAEEAARLDREVPLADLDEAIDELVACVLDIADITRVRAPIERGAPKVGRNDPCPCGSGRKYKHCHGRDVH